MKVYFAHPKNMYGTEQEASEIALIEEQFDHATIVNPAIFERLPKDRENIMDYYFRMVTECDALVFRRLAGKISAGVGREANLALSQGKRVFELDDRRFIEVTQPVEPISIEETRKLLLLSANSSSP